MRRAFTLATTAAASLIRAGHGTQVFKGVEEFKRPEKILTLYLKEACPFSRFPSCFLTITVLIHRLPHSTPPYHHQPSPPQYQHPLIHPIPPYPCLSFLPRTNLSSSSSFLLVCFLSHIL